MSSSTFAGLTNSPRSPTSITGRINACHGTRARISKLAEAQEELCGTRQQLLIKRMNNVAARKEVRNLREMAAGAEAEFMSALRNFIHSEAQCELPDHLTEAFNQLQGLRDKLGPIECDQLDQEAELSGHEWRFIDKENELYDFDLQEVISDPICDSESHTDHEVVPKTATQDSMRSLPPQPSLLSSSTVIPHDVSIRPEIDSRLSPPQRNTLPTSAPSWHLPNHASEHDFTAVAMMLELLRQQSIQARERRTIQVDHIENGRPFRELAFDQCSESLADGASEAVFDLLEELKKTEARIQLLRRDMCVLDLPNLGSTTIQGVNTEIMAPGVSNPSQITPLDAAATRKVQQWRIEQLRDDVEHTILLSNILQSRGLESGSTYAGDDRLTDFLSLDAFSERA